MLCLEEMELDLPGGVVAEQEGVLVEEGQVVVEWEGPALEPDPVGSVSVLIVALIFLIKQEFPAIT